MNRIISLIIVLIFFVIFLLINYFGNKITLWSSFILSLFISFILLNFLYPISNIPSDEGDFTLVIYVIFYLISILFILIYIIVKTLSDVRKN